MDRLCNQCAMAVRGTPAGDFTDAVAPQEPLNEEYGFAMCARCGPTLVNSKGDCVTQCSQSHGKEPSLLDDGDDK